MSNIKQIKKSLSNILDKNIDLFRNASIRAFQTKIDTFKRDNLLKFREIIKGLIKNRNRKAKITVKEVETIIKKEKQYNQQIKQEEQEIMNIELPLVVEEDPYIIKTISKFKNVAETISITPRHTQEDYKVFINNIRSTAYKVLQEKLNKYHQMKLIITIEAIFIRDVNDEYEQDNEIKASFSSGAMEGKNKRSRPIVDISDIKKTFIDASIEIEKQIEDFIKRGSQWMLKEVTDMYLKIVPYFAFNGSSYLALPDWINKKHCVINIKNNDDRCFEYAVLCGQNIKEIKQHPERVSNYDKYLDTLNFDNINFPVSLDDIELFESQNNQPINIFSVNEEDNELVEDEEHSRHRVVYLNKLSSSPKPIIDLLIYTNNQGKSHYCYIKKLQAFVRNGEHELHICNKCLQKFKLLSAYDNHILKNKCMEYKEELVKVLPSSKPKYNEKTKKLENKSIIKYNNTKKELILPVVIYADCETMLKEVNIIKGEKTELYQQHECYNVAATVVSRYPELIKNSYVEFTGVDSMPNFIKYCKEIEKQTLKIYDTNKAINMSESDKISYKKAVVCHICKANLDDDKVRDHDHITGFYRGAAHSHCNINYNYKNAKVPVIFHNLKGYDGHLIMQHTNNFEGSEIKPIATTSEKYLAFSVGRLNFLDSNQFLSASLDRLVTTMNNNEIVLFKNSLKITSFRDNIDKDTLKLVDNAIIEHDKLLNEINNLNNNQIHIDLQK